MNKSPTFNNSAQERANTPLSQETVHSLNEFGEVLREIHERLLSEGYIIKEGKIFKPESRTNNGGNQ